VALATCRNRRVIMFRTVIRYGDGTGDVRAEFVDYGNAVVWGIGVAEEETGSPVWFGDDALGLEASALTPDGMRDRLNAEGADSPLARLVDECTTNALMDTPLIGWVELGTHVPEPEREGTSGSGIRLSGYVDAEAGVIVCRLCGDNGDGVWMEPVYTPDVNEDTPPCGSCNSRLEQ
jgi:hypothetical protein